MDNKNELTNAFGNPDSYDGNGNLVAANGSHNEYVYDDENQLIQWFNYQLSSTSRSAGDKRTDFVYDGLGRLRVRVEYVLACQTSTNGGGGGDSFVGGGSAQTQSEADNCTWNVTNEVHYVYDGRRVIQERNGSNTPTCAYTRGNDLSVSLEGAGGIGGLLARTKYISGSPTSFALYFSDGNGNLTSLIDTNQSVLASYRYDPFGNIISKSGTLADVNVYRFSSKEVHVNSGMYYYGYRFYDPNAQRWVNRDPLGDTASLPYTADWLLSDVEQTSDEEMDEGNDFATWVQVNRNLYSSVDNNPVDERDSFGLSGDINLGEGYTCRVDTFNTGTAASHEIHVYKLGTEVGVFGPRGWILKHGFKQPPTLSQGVGNALNGVSVDAMRSQGMIPPKGRGNIRGLRGRIGGRGGVGGGRLPLFLPPTEIDGDLLGPNSQMPRNWQSKLICR